jgi:hypothetical protein
VTGRQAIVLHYPEADRRSAPGPADTVRFGPFANLEDAGRWARAELPDRSFHLSVLNAPDTLTNAVAEWREDHGRDDA